MHLREVLNKLRSAGLVLNLPKCTFGRSSVDFLGHLVSSHGIRPLAAKVEALCGHPQLNTVKELQQFLGLLNFYRRFILSAAKVLVPLTEVLKGQEQPLQTAELSHPSPQAKLALVADTSTTHIGATHRQ